MDIDLEEALAIAKSNKELLKSITQEGRNRIPERLFKKAGLPLLLCEDPEVDLTEWVRVAGNPQKEVEVIDDAGRVLYIVPPLINTRMVGKKETVKMGLDQAIHTQMLKLKAGHYALRKSRSLIRDTVSPLLKMVIQDPIALEQWNIVLKANGVDTLTLVDGKNKEIPQAERTNALQQLFTGEVEE